MIEWITERRNPIAPLVSVIMPTYEQAPFIMRAVDSLLGQTLTDWELIVVDDGSPDGTRDIVAPLLTDARISYLCLERNRGLGAALNHGLEATAAPLIAYLPSDDLFYAGHLRDLIDCLREQSGAIAAYSGVRHHYNRTAPGQIDGYPLQLVQVAHRRTNDRWVERGQLVTDDLDRMFWSRLRRRGAFQGTGRVTCEWVDHPAQGHKVIREPEGGINPYRVRYRVEHPLRFHSTVGNRIDEVEHFRRYRERPDTPPAADGLKILLVGELAYNADRVLALEERGHTLYGLWMPDPYWYNTVGPLPFGHVRDLPRNGWQAAIRDLKPDIIYAQLNWQAVPFAHKVMRATPDIPFVWHFKEGPFICLEKGTWPQLIDLYARADGRIYVSPEMRDWFLTVAHGIEDRGRCLVLDGDLPKADWFEGDRSPLLSSQDGEPHTVVPGRPIGLTPERVADLARNRVHLHFYGDFTRGQWVAWIEQVMRLAPDHLHLHPTVDQDRWVSEFSRYDAGWLHFFRSENEGEIRRANWDDLNCPARMATLAAAGLPMLQADNRGSVVATQSLVREHDIGLFFADMDELAVRLRDSAEMARLRANSWRARHHFTFDYHADRLIEFLRAVIADRRARGGR